LTARHGVGYATPAACMILPHATDFATLWTGAVPMYRGKVHVEASVSAIDAVTDGDAEVLALHEWELSGDSEGSAGLYNVSLFAHLTDDDQWEPMILLDSRHQVSYTIIEYSTVCDFCTGMNGSSRDKIFDIKHTTPLNCKPLG
jgi:hypothetical protein